MVIVACGFVGCCLLSAADCLMIVVCGLLNNVCLFVARGVLFGVC